MLTLPAILLLALALRANGHTAPPIIAVPVPPPPVITPLPARVFQPTPAPHPDARIVRRPQPRLPAQAYISPDDYPASALSAGAEGRVRFRLDVGPNGRVHGCAITRSSGSSALDSSTCRILRSRARFTPAIDNNGNPASGTVSDEIMWILPAGGERG